MNKKPSLKLQISFQSTVKLSRGQLLTLSRIINLAEKSLLRVLTETKIVHPSWLLSLDSIHFSLLLCGKSRIKKLNHLYRNKNKITDVLSFPVHETLRKAKRKSFDTSGDSRAPSLFLGDIAICQEKVIGQSKLFGVSYADELIHLLAHGFIHLLGYDHELSTSEEKIMKRQEEVALNIFSELKRRHYPLKLHSL